MDDQHKHHHQHNPQQQPRQDEEWPRRVAAEPHVHHAEHDAQRTPGERAGHGHGHGAHDKHAGHSPEMFRDRFWVALILTVPILYFSEQMQLWLGYHAVSFPGVEMVNPVLGTVLFLYGGLVFLQGARHEILDRQPGMMTLISLAITLSYVYIMAVTLGLPGMPFFWELATLITIMLLGHRSEEHT